MFHKIFRVDVFAPYPFAPSWSATQKIPIFFAFSTALWRLLRRAKARKRKRPVCANQPFESLGSPNGDRISHRLINPYLSAEADSATGRERALGSVFCLTLPPFTAVKIRLQETKAVKKAF
jgi:hypothetical protein